ncbi:TldD/PmbA family protein [Sandarakinorhabdus sp.]|uniref:TldD/PmbA family protein n=1 Tax=Sandarakinorhabdus sp. TaxID=1916663 RepID=UPI00286E592A|nr:TldD/PmbA family protein [Sandarakinorhabdus sp.]
MLSPEDALTRLDAALAAARAAGADAADALYVGDGSTSISVRLGQLEDIGRAEGEEIGIRVFVGQRSASVSSSDLTAAALQEAAMRAVAMARLAPEDPYAGLAPQDRLARGPLPELDVDDPTDISAAELKQRALECEDAARAIAGITNSEGAGAAAGTVVMALATSTGFRGGKRSTSHSLSASVVAGTGSDMQRDYAWHSARHLADLESAAEIGTRAGQRAVQRLGPIKLPSGPMTVLFDPRVSSSLIGHLVGSITGSAIARGTSFLKDKLGQAILPAGLSLIDDPLRRRGLRSRAFDGEGLPAARTAIIENGVLTNWLMDAASARQLGLAPTGHASRGTSGPPGAGTTNLHLEGGTATPAELMADIKQGILVTELIGMGVNGLTGDYSRGASGYRIENGVVTGPVAEITIAGNLLDMFARLVAANDLAFRHASNAPTLRIDGMMVAGS